MRRVNGRHRWRTFIINARFPLLSPHQSHISPHFGAYRTTSRPIFTDYTRPFHRLVRRGHYLFRADSQDEQAIGHSLWHLTEARWRPLSRPPCSAVVRPTHSRSRARKPGVYSVVGVLPVDSRQIPSLTWFPSTKPPAKAPRPEPCRRFRPRSGLGRDAPRLPPRPRRHTSWWGLLSWFFVITALHGVFDAMAILLSTTCGGLTLAPVAVLLVGWSRLYLKRHTFPPVLAGGVLGSMIFLVLLSH